MASIQPLASDSQAGRRRHSRLRVCLPARLITLDGTLAATLLDLSFRGAKVALGRCDLRCGDNAVLTWSTFEAFCTVAWVKDDACGLDFDVPLRPNLLIATRDLADATRKVDARRTAAEDWATGRVSR